MVLLCPVCNGLEDVTKDCPFCGNTMKEAGTVTQFLGPYSPYLSAHEGYEKDKTSCTHIFFCHECNLDKRIDIPKIKW